MVIFEIVLKIFVFILVTILLIITEYGRIDKPIWPTIIYIVILVIMIFITIVEIRIWRRNKKKGQSPD